MQLLQAGLCIVLECPYIVLEGHGGVGIHL